MKVWPSCWGEKADTPEKPSQLGVLVPGVRKALLPKYPFGDLSQWDSTSWPAVRNFQKEMIPFFP